MITKYDYLTALDIVEKYHEQILTSKKNVENFGKTLLGDWDKIGACSTRLRNILQNHSNNYYIEDISYSTFKTFRDAGKKTWSEFVKLRGY